MQLSLGGSAQVDFGDGREDVTVSTDGYVHMSHVYAESGEHIIYVYLMSGYYYLGVNDATPAIDPISSVRRIEFA